MRNQTEPAATSKLPKRSNGGRRSANSPTAIGTATVSTRATTSSHTYSDAEPEAVTRPVIAHSARAAKYAAPDPAR